MKLLILDLDGTLRQPTTLPDGSRPTFIQSPEAQELIPGVEAAIAQYKRWGYAIVGASNQGGVAAGHKRFDACCEEQLITLELCPSLRGIVFCPDYEGRQLIGVFRGMGMSNHIDCSMRYPGLAGTYRKPDPGMINFFLVHYMPDKVLFVGDRPEDEAAALAANVPFMWAKDWWRQES